MTTETTTGTPDRDVGVDAGRIIATLMVIAVHLDVRLSPSTTWLVLIWEVLCRVGVPFFFVASGYYALRATATLGGTIAHLWQRILPLMVVWNFVYFVFQGVPKGAFWRVLVTGAPPAYHLWFFPSLMMCLLLLALARKVATPAVIVGIGLLLYAVALAYRPYATFLGLDNLPKIWNVRNGPFFGFIFVAAGYYLRVNGVPRLAVGLSMFIGGVLLHAAETVLLYRVYDQSPHAQEILIGTIFMGIGAFITCLRSDGFRPFRWLAPWGRLALGVYALHLLFLVPLVRELQTDKTDLLEATGLLLLCFLLSLGTAWLLARIPAFRRFVS